MDKSYIVDTVMILTNRFCRLLEDVHYIVENMRLLGNLSQTRKDIVGARESADNMLIIDLLKQQDPGDCYR
jgi:hypothetical protein